MIETPLRWRTELERLRAAASPGPRPFVTVAFATSVDLCLSHTQGAPTAVSSAAATLVTHQLRALHQALLVGVGTVLTDDPQLTTRHAPGPSPQRVVLDSLLRTPSTARVLSPAAAPTLLFTTERAPLERARALEASGAQVVRVESCPAGVALPALLAELHARGVASLMVEGGVAVLESFFSSGLVDFVAVTVSPQRFDNPGAVRLGPYARAALTGWEAEAERVGVDTLRSGAPQRSLKVAS